MVLPHAEQLLLDAHAAGAFPAAAIEVGRTAGPIWRTAVGRLTYDSEAAPARVDTVFDLASLTKVIVTTSLVMRHVRAGTLDLDTPVARLRPAWRDDARGAVRIRHLLDHSSGLPAHRRLWESVRGRAAFDRAMDEIPLERQPGALSVYSDVGFILLGFLLEQIDGRPLDAQFAALSRDWGTALRFRPPADWPPIIAPTENDPWRGRLLCGEVHDENAAALEGVAAHAGLFGTVEDVGRFARLVLATHESVTSLGTPELMRTFAARTGVPASSRALGWDTMKPTSSCGTKMSRTAIGHTGFTGTSLWIDAARDVYVALLTNRVHPTRDNNSWATWRPRVHDAVGDDLEAAGGLLAAAAE